MARSIVEKASRKMRQCCDAAARRPWLKSLEFGLTMFNSWWKMWKCGSNHWNFGRAMKLQKSSDSDWPSTNDEVKCNQLPSATRQCVLNFWVMTSKANKIGCSNKLHFLIQPMSQYNSSTVLLQPISNSWAEKISELSGPSQKSQNRSWKVGQLEQLRQYQSQVRTWRLHFVMENVHTCSYIPIGHTPETWVKYGLYYLMII